MPAESASGERFAHDMRRIRETRDVSQDDIHEETRIATTLISAFEQDGLFEHPAFNRVYLRSFVRAYAGCIDIEPELALNHLERALAGEYENELAAHVLDTTPSMGGYDVDESDESSPRDDDTRVSSPVDRPLSKQEQEPPRFSPRPVGGATKGGATENVSSGEEGEDKQGVDESADNALREPTGESDDASVDASHESLEKVVEERRDEERDAEETASEEAAEKETFTPDRPDDTSSPDTPPNRSTASNDTTPDGSDHAEASEATPGNETEASETAPTQDDLDETAQQSSSFTGEPPGAVFNKRPMGSGSAGASDGGGASEAENDTDEAAENDVDSRTISEPDDVSAAGPDSEAIGPTEEIESRDTADVERSEEEDESSKVSPAQRFRKATEGGTDAPPPPPQGQMVGKPRPVGSATDTTRSARDSSQGPVESPMAARSEKQRADRDLRVSEVFDDNRTVVIGGAVVVGVLIVSVAFWLIFSGGSNGEEAASPTASAPQAQTTNEQPDPQGSSTEGDAGTTQSSQPPRANIALGDTLRLVVEAQTDILGMKIQRDGDVRRPYWINAGETMAFPFTDRIIVWDNIQNVDLYLQRYRYPETQHIDARGRVVVTRDSADVFARTVRGAAASFPEPTVRSLDETFPDPEPGQTTPEDTSVPSDTTPPDISPTDDSSVDTIGSNTVSQDRLH